MPIGKVEFGRASREDRWGTRRSERLVRGHISNPGRVQASGTQERGQGDTQGDAGSPRLPSYLASLLLAHVFLPFLFLPAPSPWHHHPTVCPMNLSVPGTSEKGSHAAVILLCLAEFAGCSGQGSFMLCRCQNFTPFLAEKYSTCIAFGLSLVSHLVYPFVCWWTFASLLPFGFREQCCCEHLCTNLCSFLAFSPWGTCPGVKWMLVTVVLCSAL